MSFQGTYDPNLYDPSDPSTWPQPIAGPPWVPGMYWELLDGAWDGTPVAAGDRVYVDGRERLWGELAFGEGEFGGNLDGPWFHPEVLIWVLWTSSDSPWLVDPPPGAGCPYTPDGVPDGWRIVVDTIRQDWDTAGVAWVDVTSSAYDVTIQRGANTASHSVPVDAIGLALLDPDDVFSIDLALGSPEVGDVLRVGFTTPPNLGAAVNQTVLASQAYEYRPLATGRITEVLEDHSTDDAGNFIRQLAVTAYGMLTDLVVPIPEFSSSDNENAAQRIGDIVAASGYDWSALALPGAGWELEKETSALDIEARGELDRVALSTGWQMDTDSRGQLRFREYPVPVSDDPAGTVVDCYIPGTNQYVASQMILVNDLSQNLNRAQAGNLSNQNAQAEDVASIDRLSINAVAWGFPAFQLATRNQADLDVLVQRMVDRFGRIVSRVDNLTVSTAVWPDWLDLATQWDMGDTLVVGKIYGADGDPDPTYTVFRSQIIGFEYGITPDRFTCTPYFAGGSPTALSTFQVDRTIVSGPTRTITSGSNRTLALPDDPRTTDTGARSTESDWRTV